MSIEGLKFAREAATHGLQRCGLLMFEFLSPGSYKEVRQAPDIYKKRLFERLNQINDDLCDLKKCLTDKSILDPLRAAAQRPGAKTELRTVNGDDFQSVHESAAYIIARCTCLRLIELQPDIEPILCRDGNQFQMDAVPDWALSYSKPAQECAVIHDRLKSLIPVNSENLITEIGCESTAAKLLGDGAIDTSSPLSKKKTRAGRINKKDSDAKRTEMLTRIRQTPGLALETDLLANSLGVSKRTIVRWISTEQEKFNEDRRRKSEDN